MKYDVVFATVASILGIIGVLLAFGLTFQNSVVIYNALICIVCVAMGVIGIWLSKKDPVKSVVLYVIAAIGIFIGLGYLEIISSILFILAAILTFIKRNSYNINPATKDDRLWLIHIVLTILLIGFILLGINAISENHSTQQNSDLFVENYTITPVSNSKYNYQYYVSCDVVPLHYMDHLEMHVTFYDSSGAVIGQSPLIWSGSNLSRYEVVNASGIATTSGTNQAPSKAVVYFYDKTNNGAIKSEAIYAQTVNL